MDTRPSPLEVYQARVELAWLKWCKDSYGHDWLTANEIRQLAQAEAERERILAAARRPMGKAILCLEHVEVRENVAACLHCGAGLCLPLPQLELVYEEEMRAFAEQHEHCTPRDYRDLDLEDLDDECKGK